MANVKITGLDALAEAPNGADLVEIVDDVAGTPTSKKITIANLMANTVSSYNDTGVTLTNTTTENTISVDQNGNVGTAVATDGAVHIENTGNTGIGLGVYTNIGATADAPLVSISADNAAFDQSLVRLSQGGVKEALYVNVAGVTAAATGGVWIYSNAIQVSSPLVFIEQDNASSSKQALFIQNDGTSAAIEVDNNGDGTAFYIDSAATSFYTMYLKTTANRATRPMVYFEDAGTSTSIATLKTKTDGSGSSVLLDVNGTGIGLEIDHDDVGTAATIDINRSGNNAGAVVAIKTSVANAGAGGAYAFSFAGSEVVSAAVGGTQDRKIRVLVGGTTYYIPCHTA